MKGKTVIITGATNGIGKATAIALAEKGAHLVLVGRNKEKAEAVKTEIRQKTANKQVDLLFADLSSMAEVKKLSVKILQKYPKIDVLLNNAGAFFQKRSMTVDDFERTFALNHLAYFLLTRELLERIKENPDGARIINVSSAAHVRGKLDWGNLMSKGDYSGFQAYCDSKLANVLFTCELAKRLEDTKVTANAVHPGAVSTGFGKETKGFFKFVMKIFRPFMLSEEKGAQTSIYLASSPDVEGITGKYWAKSKQETTAPQANEEKDWKKLWDVSNKLLKTF